MHLYLDGTINPIAALQKRECKELPLHFTSVKLPEETWNLKPYKEWIAKNLSGRYFVGERFVFKNDYAVKEYVASFEEPGEATMFALIAATLKDPADIF